MTEILLPGYLHRESEFTHNLLGTCGPCALASAASWSDQRYVSTYDMYLAMRAHNLCDTNGASTIGGLYYIAQILGYPIRQMQWFWQGWPSWRQFFSTALGKYAVAFEVSNGQAFRDYLTGAGENAWHLEYHYVCLVGYNSGGPSSRPEAQGKILPAGWWIADGDNFDNGNVLQFYPDSVLAAAAPCAAVALGNRATIHGSGTPMLTIQNAVNFFTQLSLSAWKCKQTGFEIANGMLSFYCSMPAAGDWNGLTALGLPISNEIAQGQPVNGVQPTIQHFERGDLAYDPHHVLDTPPGAAGSIYVAHSVDKYMAALGQLNTQLSASERQVATLNTQVGDFASQLKTANAQIAALQAELANNPYTSAIQSLSKALATVNH